MYLILYFVSEFATWLFETYRSSLRIQTKFYILLCISRYRYCIELTAFLAASSRFGLYHFLTWQRLMFRSYGGPTHSYVTSPQNRSPQDRYLTSHRYSARPTQLLSPTAEPAPEALLTRSLMSRQFLQSARLKLLVCFFFLSNTISPCTICDSAS